ncbi:hypothetical protein MBLNU459_g4379t1 [Dothideomycetes sp. NU459]
MSALASKIALLALATSACAVPFVGGHRDHHPQNAGHKQHHKQHHHLHHTGHHGTGTGSPYSIANASGLYPTGTAAGSDLAAPSNYAPSPVMVQSDVAVAAVASGTDGASASCTDGVVHTTVTNRNTVYVTAKASSAANSAAEADVAESSTVASASLTLSAVQKGYGAHKWHPRPSSTAKSSSTLDTSSVAAPATSSSSSVVVAPVATSTTSSSTSVYVAPTTSTSTSTSVHIAPTTSTSTSVHVSATTSSTTTSSAAATTSSTSSSSSGKRGVAYNDASLTTQFESAAEVTWGYNWGQYSSGLSSGFNYVPLLWGTASSFTSGWSAAAQSAINSGSTHLMSFNEPDLSSQSNLSPAAAAIAYKTYMQPFAGKAKLGAPAVTNGGGATGLDWLNAFLAECSDCTIDFVAIHWYDSSSNAAYFKDQVANATAVAGGKPVWVTEFGCTDGTDADISNFLQEVMPWMDEQAYVERYSYFMVADGYLVSSATELSTYGSTYKSYVS